MTGTLFLAILTPGICLSFISTCIRAMGGHALLPHAVSYKVHKKALRSEMMWRCER